MDGSRRRSSNAYPALRSKEFPSFRFVTITIGGNDLGFADVLTTCTLNGDRACEKRAATAVDFIHSQLPGRLDATYATIREAAPHARLVVVGYPRLFTPDDGCRTLSTAKRQVLNDAADQLSGEVGRAAGRAGARYVDVREAFADHGVCADEPWIHGLISPTADSYHPDKAGQAAYFAALAS